MRHIVRIGTAVLAVLAILFFLHKEYREEGGKRQAFLSVQVGDEVIQAWEIEVCYFFLPCGAVLSEVRLTAYSAAFLVSETGQDFRGGDSLEGLPVGEEISCVKKEGNLPFELMILQSENLPSLFLDTSSGSLEKIHADKEHEEKGAFRLWDEEGNVLFSLGVTSFSGRGNTTFAGYEKKPYSLELKEEASLLGLPAGTEYVLFANASDPLLIRNDLSRRMEEVLGVEFAHRGRFVDLYINEIYQGNYYLVDRMEIGENKINILNMEGMMDLLYQQSNYEAIEVYETDTLKARLLSHNPNDITGGYLLEREYGDRYEHEYDIIGSGFITEGKEHFVIKSPRYCSKEQVEYLQDYVNQAEAAIMAENGLHPETGKSYQEYLDVNSFVRRYLVEEISKNYDAGVTSTFFYKKSEAEGGKLYFAPGWDYDMSWGNGVEWMEYHSNDPEGITELAFHEYASHWHTALCSREEFSKLIKEIYEKEASLFLEEVLGSILDEYKELLTPSALMDHLRWQEELVKNSNYVEWEEGFIQLKEFIRMRKVYLDEAWGS